MAPLISTCVLIDLLTLSYVPLHCMFFGAKKVRIRSEYTRLTGFEKALIWYIEHILWTRIPKDRGTFGLANPFISRNCSSSFKNS